MALAAAQVSPIRVEAASCVPGTYHIDAGKVQLTAPPGAAADELDGAGLIFGNFARTFLIIVDATPGTPGTVTIKGPVTLGQLTTTTMNFVGATNTADLLDVRNGALTLNGTLSLFSFDGAKPTRALVFFDDANPGASINGNFTSIMDNAGGKNDTGMALPGGPGWIYDVTIP